MKRVTYLIDGFNLYHSLIHYGDTVGISVKWLDLIGLCRSYVPNVAAFVHDTCSLEEVVYFTAYARHAEAYRPGAVSRHRHYMYCLMDSGVRVKLGRFKEKEIKCSHCAQRFTRHEEKETDVAIGVEAMSLLATGRSDVIVLVTGDSDLVPAIAEGRRIFQNAFIGALIPEGKPAKNLTQSCDFSMKMRQRAFPNHILPDPYLTRSGMIVNKPTEW